MIIQFKTPKEDRDWNSGNIPKLLREVVEFYSTTRRLVLGDSTTLTEVHSTKERDLRIGRRYATHREWRAVDCRVDMNQFDLEEAIRVLVNFRYPTGISSMPRIAPLRHGTAPHAHIQITRGEKDAQ